MKLIQMILAVSLGASLCRGQIVTYTFETDVKTSATADSNLTASIFDSSDGTTSFVSGADSSATAISENGWDGTAGDKYFEFTLTAQSGYQIDITSLTFNHRAGGGTPQTTIELRTSTNAFSGGWTSGTLQTVSNSATRQSSSFASSGANSGIRSVTIAGIEDVTSAITVRVIASGSASSTATFAVDNIEVFGTVSAVPEPSSFAALVGLGALGMVATRRRRQKSASPLTA